MVFRIFCHLPFFELSYLLVVPLRQLLPCFGEGCHLVLPLLLLLAQLLVQDFQLLLVQVVQILQILLMLLLFLLLLLLEVALDRGGKRAELLILLILQFIDLGFMLLFQLICRLLEGCGSLITDFADEFFAQDGLYAYGVLCLGGGLELGVLLLRVV